MHKLLEELKAIKQKPIVLIATVATVFFLLFCLFSFIVKSDALVQWDFNTTVRLQNNISPRFDPYFSFLSLLGSFEVMIIVLVTALILRRKILALLVIPLFGIGHVLEIVGKYFLLQPGPPFLFHRYSFDFFFPSSYVQPGSAYPSGHSYRVVYLAIILGYVIWKTKKIPQIVKYVIVSAIILITLATLISRPILGEHWPTDVVGGTLLAISFGLLSLLFL